MLGPTSHMLPQPTESGAARTDKWFAQVGYPLRCPLSRTARSAPSGARALPGQARHGRVKRRPFRSTVRLWSWSFSFTRYGANSVSSKIVPKTSKDSEGDSPLAQCPVPPTQLGSAQAWFRGDRRSFERRHRIARPLDGLIGPEESWTISTSGPYRFALAAAVAATCGKSTATTAKYWATRRSAGAARFHPSYPSPRRTVLPRRSDRSRSR
jgi:hypothetical protein